MTRYAKQILELINQSDAHMTAEEIFLELKKKAPKVVLATVYNNLNTLCREGMIRKLSLEGAPDRYDKKRNRIPGMRRSWRLWKNDWGRQSRKI